MAEEAIGLDAEIRHELDELVERGLAAIVAATEAAATELRETHIPDEAPQGVTGNLAADWRQREVDPLAHVVSPGTEAWYAHIVARGRTAVRPRDRRALTIGGEFRAHAGPTSPDPFDERAIAAAERSSDDLLADALSAQGLEL